MNNLPSSSTTSYMFSSWRKSILQQLNERDLKELKPFKKLIEHCNKQFESSDALLSDYFHSIHSYNNTFRMTGDYPSGSQTLNINRKFTCEKCMALEKKLFLNQEELTDVHRKRNELSTKILMLKEQIKNLEQEKNRIIASLENVQKDLSDARELDEQRKLLKTEHELLQTAYNNLNKNHIELDKEHKKLINRSMSEKTKHLERLNQEREKIQRLQEILKRKELEFAAREMRFTMNNQKNLKNQTNLSNVIQDGPIPLTNLSTIPNRILLSKEIHDGEVTALKWISGQHRFRKQDILVTGGDDGKVRIWQINQKSLINLDTFTNSNAAITSIDIDDKYLLASSSDFANRLWTINDSKLFRTFTGHLDKVSAVKFLGTSSKSVSGSYDRTIKIWDINKHVCLRTLFAGSRCNDLVTREGHEAEIISGHYDKTIRFFDIRTDSSGNNIQLQNKITSLTISQNSPILLSCDRSNTLKLFDLRMNQQLQSFKADNFKVGCDWTRATISPDSEFVASGSSDGGVFIFNANNGKLEKELQGGHTSNVNVCTWSPNGQLFITCDKSKKIAIWTL